MSSTKPLAEDLPDPDKTAVETLYAQSGSSSSTLPLARAMAMLQKTSARAVYPRELSDEDKQSEIPARPRNRAQPKENVELALMSRITSPKTSCLEASRRYAGAKTIM